MFYYPAQHQLSSSNVSIHRSPTQGVCLLPAEGWVLLLHTIHPPQLRPASTVAATETRASAPQLPETNGRVKVRNDQ